MIFADTSVWIDFFKNANSKVSVHLKELLKEDRIAISGITRLEILCGASRKNFPVLQELLSAVPTFYADENSFHNLEIKIQKSVNAGYRFGIADLLIAETVETAGGILWTLDSDFFIMEKLSFVRLYKEILKPQ